MPVYAYFCNCGHEEEQFREYEARHNVECPKCGQRMHIDFGKLLPYVTPELWTRDPITGEHKIYKPKTDKELAKNNEICARDTREGREMLKEAHERWKEHYRG